MLHIACAAVIFSAGCAGTRTVRIESNRPARILDSGNRLVCEASPCAWVVSRETCRLFDSSSGHVILTAEAEDGTTMISPAMVTCDIEDDTLVRFELPSEPGARDCAVVIVDSRETRFSCDELLGPR